MEAKVGQRWLMNNLDNHCENHNNIKYIVEVQESGDLLEPLEMKIIQIIGESERCLFKTNVGEIRIIGLTRKTCCYSYLEGQDKSI